MSAITTKEFLLSLAKEQRDHLLPELIKSHYNSPMRASPLSIDRLITTTLGYIWSVALGCEDIPDDYDFATTDSLYDAIGPLKEVSDKTGDTLTIRMTNRVYRFCQSSSTQCKGGPTLKETAETTGLDNMLLMPADFRSFIEIFDDAVPDMEATLEPMVDEAKKDIIGEQLMTESLSSLYGNEMGQWYGFNDGLAALVQDKNMGRYFHLVIIAGLYEDMIKYQEEFQSALSGIETSHFKIITKNMEEYLHSDIHELILSNR